MLNLGPNRSDCPLNLKEKSFNEEEIEIVEVGHDNVEKHGDLVITNLNQLEVLKT